MRHTLIAALLALLFGAMGTPAQRVAAAEWCDTDPLVVIQTPAGNLVPVYVLISVLGVEHLPAAQAASITSSTYAVKSLSGGLATRVQLTVLVPGDAFASDFPTRAAASSGPMGSGIVYDSTAGTSGQEMTLKFVLDVP